MKLSAFFRIVAAAASILLPISAHADLTTTIKMAMDLSKMTIGGKKLTPEQLAKLKNSPLSPGNIDMVTYQSGNKVKTVSPFTVSITDLDSKTSTILMPATKQYMTVPLPAGAMKQFGDSGGANVIDMRSTQTVMGHVTHEYKLYIKNAMMTMTAYAWVAKDIPSPVALGSGNPMLGMFNMKLAGTPLMMSVDMLMPGAFGQMAFTYRVTDISKKTIPASTFATPVGYTLMQANAQGGSSGEKPLLKPGVTAPDFTVSDRNGNPVKLSDFAGHVVVIDFWATWCEPCQESLPTTNSTAEKYRSRNVVFLGVNVWDTKDSFKA